MSEFMLTMEEHNRRLEEVWMEGYWAAYDDLTEGGYPTPNPYEEKE